MRVIVFAALYYPFQGGYVESIHELVKRLAAQGYAITIVTCNTHCALSKEDIDEIQIYRLPCLNPRWLNNTFPIPLPTLATLRILRSAFKERPDIISTQTRFFPTSWLGFFIGKIKRVPIIHTERGATHSIASSRLISWIAILIDHTLGWMIARFSSTTIGVSDASCKFLRHLDAKNPVKIYNGADVEFWKKPATTVIASEAKQSREIVITFVGRLIYAKGVQDLLHAVAELKNVIINIIGDGAYRATLEKLASKLKINNNVRFLGEMTKEQIRDILWQTDIFVNPSHSEGLPRSVLEAAAVGLPIIATNTGGTKEIIGEDRGILIAPHDTQGLAQTIKKLLEDRDRCAMLGQYAQEYVRAHFAWEKITIQYTDLFATYASHSK